MSIASVIGCVQRFISGAIQSLGRRDQCRKPMMLFAGNSGGQCPPYIRDRHGGGDPGGWSAPPGSPDFSTIDIEPSKESYNSTTCQGLHAMALQELFAALAIEPFCL